MTRALPGMSTPSDRHLWDAILLLERRAGVAAGEPFKTTRIALIVESGLRGITVDASLYRLERDGFIHRQGVRGAGTTIEVLR